VSANLFVLSYAVLGGIFQRRERRAFWAGFAIVGWGYTCFITHELFGYSMYEAGTQTSPVVTTTVLKGVGSMLKESRPASDGDAVSGSSSPQWPSLGPAGASDSSPNDDPTTPPPLVPIACFVADDDYFGSVDGRRFLLIGQSLWSLLLGYAAGSVARRMYVSAR
jgi:hypothetical protein